MSDEVSRFSDVWTLSKVDTQLLFFLSVLVSHIDTDSRRILSWCNLLRLWEASMTLTLSSVDVFYFDDAWSCPESRFIYSLFVFFLLFFFFFHFSSYLLTPILHFRMGWVGSQIKDVLLQGMIRWDGASILISVSPDWLLHCHGARKILESKILSVSISDLRLRRRTRHSFLCTSLQGRSSTLSWRVIFVRSNVSNILVPIRLSHVLTIITCSISLTYGTTTKLCIFHFSFYEAYLESQTTTILEICERSSPLLRISTSIRVSDIQILWYVS